MLSYVMNLRHALRLTSPGACVPFDLQLSTFNFSSCNSFTFFSFRTLCQIPGIGYPPNPLFLDSFLIRSPQSSTVALRSASAPRRGGRFSLPRDEARGVYHSVARRSGGVQTRLLASLLFATHTDLPSRKSFVCHSYENNGGVCQLFPKRNYHGS